jgi:hypothetical protein
VANEAHKNGDLWVQYTVAFPPSLTEAQKELIRSQFS